MTTPWASRGRALTAGGEGSMTYANQTGEHTLRFGFGRYIQQTPRDPLPGSRINTPLLSTMLPRVGGLGRRAR